MLYLLWLFEFWERTLQPWEYSCRISNSWLVYHSAIHVLYACPELQRNLPGQVAYPRPCDQSHCLRSNELYGAEVCRRWMRGAPTSAMSLGTNLGRRLQKARRCRSVVKYISSWCLFGEWVVSRKNKEHTEVHGEIVRSFMCQWLSFLEIILVYVNIAAVAIDAHLETRNRHQASNPRPRLTKT